MSLPHFEEIQTQLQYRLLERLHGSEARHARLVEALREIVFETDDDGRLTLLNGAWTETLGHAIAECLGRPIGAFVDTSVGASADILAANGEELPFCHKDGGVVWLGVSVRGTIGCLYDVSERRRAATALRDARDRLETQVEEQTVELGRASDLLRQEVNQRWQIQRALRESEAQYRLLFENNPQPMWIAQAESLSLLAVNDAAVRQYGYSRAEFLAMTVDDLGGGETTAPACGAPSPSTVAGLQVRLCRHRRKDGSALDVEARSHRLVFHGRPAILVQALDVTERLSLEAQLRQAQKMDAIGRLAGGIAHDFNNLLTAILGYSEFVLGALEKDHPSRPDVEEIYKVGGRAASLTHQLLAFSRNQPLQPVPLDLNAVIADLEKMLRRILGEDIDLVLRPQPSIRTVKADRAQIEQVLLNLVVNARDAMPTGGRLTIESASDRIDAATARNSGMVPGSYTLVSVHDTGCGMTPEVLSHLFEPFFTTKGQDKGTGLGLATAYGIVKQSSGYIGVDSMPGRGSTFRIYLPQTEETPLESTAEPANCAGSETVLIVEDDEHVRKLASGMLKHHGYRVLESRDSDDAWHLIETYEAPIHLLLTDVVLPGMNGPSLAGRILTIRPGIRVICMSGYSDHAALARMSRDSRAALLPKPFTATTLARRVREVLDAPVST